MIYHLYLILFLLFPLTANSAVVTKDALKYQVFESNLASQGGVAGVWAKLMNYPHTYMGWVVPGGIYNFYYCRYVDPGVPYEHIGFNSTLKKCYYTIDEMCPSGTSRTYSEDYSSSSCVAACPEPVPHPCDSRTNPLYQSFCYSNIYWNSNTCQWASNNCGWEEMSGFAGYYGSQYIGTNALNATFCPFGCQFFVDEVVDNGAGVHVSPTGQQCVPQVTDPDTTDLPPEDKTLEGENDNTWVPDDDPQTNCGEFNGEYICLDSIADNTCASTPSGAIVCVGSPSAPEPSTLDDIDPDLTVSNNQGNTDFYGDDTVNVGGGVIQCPPGFSYSNGLCQGAPVDNICPPGSTLQAGVCVYSDMGQWGAFNGPKMPDLSLPDIPDYNYSEILNSIYNGISNAPLLNISVNCSSSGANCPPLTAFGITSTFHCELIENATPLLQAALWAIAGIIAIRVALSA